MKSSIRTGFGRRVVRRMDKFFSSLFNIDQWVIMTARNMDFKSLDWSRLQAVVPPKDRYWADPFVIYREHRYYVFVEEKMYETGRGRIACLTLDESGGLLANEVVLEQPFHLSYPFLFEYLGETYMLPESAQNRTLDLYRCTSFPNHWELERTLMSGPYVVDATLLDHAGRWWLFANIKETGGSSLDSLYLFYADHPLAAHWNPHPRNPIVRDVGLARPAGRIFRQGQDLIRPSQDSSQRYGRAMKFNRILRINEREYLEETVSSFEPPARTKILAAHTFNQGDGLTVIDAVVRRSK